MPNANATVVPGVLWGTPGELFTPAYWLSQYLMREVRGDRGIRHRIGETFAEEVAACVLGGYGCPAQIGHAAFRRLRDSGCISSLCDDVDVLAVKLKEPLEIAGRKITYRFWRQKARYLAGAFQALRHLDLSFDCPLQLRDTLTTLPGVGPKTASWIVRNWTNTDDVAILDVHVIRAGMMMRLYSERDRVERDYPRMEERFVALARNMGIPTSDLDALIWSLMRSTPRLVARLLHNTRNSPNGPRQSPNPLGRA
jgi:thermostable 8-oxoguanine DNA glycosylase